MTDTPMIESSSEEERRAFIKEKYPCLADCEMCGLCKVFHGKDPENAYEESPFMSIHKMSCAVMCDPAKP